MTNKEIKQAEKKLQDIEKLDSGEKQGALMKFAKDYKIHLPLLRNNEEFRNELFLNIHTFLQTKIMLNACVFAKRSCFWAATAAIAACITVVVVNWSTLQELVLALKDCLLR